MKGFFDDVIDLVRRNPRVEDLRQVAREHGFSFKTKVSWAHQDYSLKSFSIFKGKKDKRIKGILRKVILPLEAEIRIYDYYYFGEMKTYKTTIYEIVCQSFDFPKFEIHPKGFLKKVQDMFLTSDKPFPEESKFHSKFNISTNDHTDFEEELNTSFLNFLLEKQNLTAEGERNTLLLYQENQLTNAEYLVDDYEDLLEMIDGILNDDTDEYV